MAWLSRATARLAAGGVASPRAEARRLLAVVAAVPSNQVELLDGVTAPQLAELERLTAERLAGRPLQHVIGRAAFRTIEVAVGPGVFIPRPETEAMVGWVLDQLVQDDATAPGSGAAAGLVDVAPVAADLDDWPKVVELGAGSGAISLALAAERPGLRLWAVENSPAALAYLIRNTADSPVTVVAQDLAQALPELDATVDQVVSNPPYIPAAAWEALPSEVRDFDPTVALLGGADGLAVVRQVAATAARLLRPGGRVACEHDDDQGVSAPAVFRAAGFTALADHLDLAGRPRFLTAVWPG
jgi:release factor glutamine methyltransferase